MELTLGLHIGRCNFSQAFEGMNKAVPTANMDDEETDPVETQGGLGSSRRTSRTHEDGTYVSARAAAVAAIVSHFGASVVDDDVGTARLGGDDIGGEVNKMMLGETFVVFQIVSKKDHNEETETDVQVIVSMHGAVLMGLALDVFLFLKQEST